MVTTATAPSLPSDLYLEPADVHVLLVDDERLSRLVVSALLCKCGYRVSTAKSGREALTLLAEKPNEHHLLLTDVMMPDVDGLQLLRYVRSSKQLKAMPVIMMSANEHSDTVFSCVQNGAEDYLLKPVTKKELRNIWQHVWRRRRAVATGGTSRGAAGSCGDDIGGAALGRTPAGGGTTLAAVDPAGGGADLPMSQQHQPRRNLSQGKQLRCAKLIAQPQLSQSQLSASLVTLVEEKERKECPGGIITPAEYKRRRLTSATEGSCEAAGKAAVAVAVAAARGQPLEILLLSALSSARELYRPEEHARPLPLPPTPTATTIETPAALPRISLLQFLSSGEGVGDGVDRLHIFRQVVDLVRDAHAQGVVLGCIQPSMIEVTPSGRVSFARCAPLDSFLVGANVGGVRRRRLVSAQPRAAETSAARPLSRQALAQALPMEGRPDSVQTIRGSSRAGSHGVSSGQLLPMELRIPSMRQEALPPAGYGDALSRPVGDPCRLWSEGNAAGGANQQQSISVAPHRRVERVMKRSASKGDWYTAPEVANGEEPSPASDVYALGMLFFLLITTPALSPEGRAQQLADLRMRILPPELLEDRPREATFVLRCVHPDPDARPTAEMAATDPVLKEAKEGLAQRQSLLEIEEHAALHELCQGFLVHQQRTKRDRVSELRGHLAQIDADILEVERRFSRLGTAPNLPTLAEIRRPAPGQQLSSSFGRGNSMLRDSLAIGQGLGQLQDAFFLVRDAALGPAVAGVEGSPPASTSLHALQQQPGPLGPAWPVDYLTTFAEDLNKFVRYSKLEVGATLKHGGMTSSANMVCSLGFDRDEEYFATAGVCKKIKVFEFGGIMERPGVGMHFPVVEMTSQSKLSSISWNPYVKNHLASSDYDGTVHIWDVAVQKPAIAYEEHRKRVWSVGFSPADPMRLVSGSDDGLVKVWSVLQRESVMTINSHANVCCVQFNPLDQHHVAFGSADYKLYYYDLRKPSMPMLVLAGHNKAVSYVSFIDGQRLVSASTDNSLKLWDISRARPLPGGNQIGCERTFSGHANEKNFVGLSVNTEGFIACGSEDNNVYIYFRALPTPLGCTHFHGTDPITGQDTADAAGQFVSAVCWRQRGNILLAANSLGDIRALRLG